MIFDTKVAGIPCQCNVIYHQAGKPAYIEGSPERATEAEPEEFEYEIFDRKGRQALWLQRKITPADDERLLEEFHVTVLEEKHSYEP